MKNIILINLNLSKKKIKNLLIMIQKSNFEFNFL